MNAVAPAETRNRWRLQKCSDSYINDLEHARFAMTFHAGHGGCQQYLTALGYGSVVCA